jgi:predicted nucleotidyltransferase
MIALVEKKKDEVADLCRRFKVERLDLFGSAATECFAPESSDLDFVVRFAERRASGEYADRYLDFAEALERLFQRRVDLVSEPSIRNPYYCRGNEETRQRMYEQAGASSKTICLS